MIPTFYDRNADGVPTRWVQLIKRAMRHLGARFCADRMVQDYTRLYYVTAVGGASSERR